MKKGVFVLMAIIIVLFLVGGASAGKVTSSSGGISSSQSGVGYGSASKVGAAGHSAFAEVLLEETLEDPVFWPPTGGSFDITTSGEEEMSDDIVTVKAEADELHITGELVPGAFEGSTVEAHAHVWASGDETGITGVWVQSMVDAFVELNLVPGAEGKASAYAAGTATGSGLYGGMEVSSNADGSVDVSAEAEGTPANGAYAYVGGDLEGYADLEGSGQDLNTYSNIWSEMELDYGASGEVTTSGSAASSADSTDLSAKTAAKGSLAIEGEASGDEGLDAWAQIEGSQTHTVATDDQESYAYVASEIMLTGNEEAFSASGEASANGEASASGQDNIAPLLFPVSSMSNSAEGSVEVTAEQEGEGTTDSYGEIESWSMLNYDDVFYSTESFDPADPAAYSQAFEIASTGLLYDGGWIYGNVVFDGNADNYEAKASASANGETSSDAAYALHSSETSTDGNVAVEVDLNGDTEIDSDAELYAANALDSAATTLTGTLNPWVMSVSTINSGGDWSGSSDDFTGKASASGEADASATFNNGAQVANGETYADGSVSGMASRSEIAGLFTAGQGADDYFVTLDGADTAASGFLTADAGLSAHNQGGIMTFEGLSFSNIASGKAGASGDINFLDTMYTGDTDVSGKVSAVSKTSAPGSWFSGAMEHSAVRDYYETSSDDGVVKAQTEAVAVALETGGDGWTSSQKVSFTGAKISADGSRQQFGESLQTSESTLAGTGTVELTAKDTSDSSASSRIYSLATTRHNYFTEADQGRIDAYYQTYFSGDDNANQKGTVQLSGVGITDKAVVTYEDGIGADHSESDSLSLKKGSAKIAFDTAKNKITITFPYVNAKISGMRDAADPEIGERVQTATYQTWSADPNVAYAQWRARVDTNVQNPAPITPPQP
jgi:hypothetical protein